MEDSTDTEWRSNANDAVEISLVQPGSDAPKAIKESFQPRFTYPIFGEEEQIFGYKGLNIGVRFAAHDLYPHCAISYSEKFKSVGDTVATDILEELKNFLPPYAFDKSEDFERRIQDEDASSFKPPGEKLHSYSRDGHSYEIWCAPLTDPAVKTLLERMQIFISFYVEAGTPLALDDQEWTLERWRVFFIFEKLPNPPTPKGSIYSFVGYATSYRFLTYLPVDANAPPATEIPPKEELSIDKLPYRGRISQFLILPIHQNQSHGSHLYNTIAGVFLSDSLCTEITVEDPNESFDKLRDFSDFNRLTKNGTFAQIKLNPDIDPKLSSRRPGVRVPTNKLIDKAKVESLKTQNKIAPRQWNRLVELYLLSQIPKSTRESGTARLTQKGKSSNLSDRAFYYWRLLAKQRIYKQNRDVLAQLDPSERIEKLEETLTGQLDEYLLLLGDLKLGDESSGASSGPSGTQRSAKRKIIDDDDDDDDDEDVAIGNGDGPDSKRRKESHE